MRHVPWIGLLAIISMFLIPMIPDWLFEGRRNVKHWPRRHICAVCAATWTADHRCDSPDEKVAEPPLRGELRRFVRGGIHPVGRAIAAPMPGVADKEPRADDTTEAI